ncbi:MAG TPA: lysophospholipid acyltransferase family protein [Baekduia sp.]|nr:lysophospholipid acyltransferase family protein [Baekduia sp.]
MDEPDTAWARRLWARAVRETFLLAMLGPTMDVYARCRVVGSEALAGVEGPVILVANHCSHMDTPEILRSLPRPLRRRTAVAAAADYFYRSRRRAIAVSLAFNTVPMRRHGGGLEPGPAQHVHALIDDGWSLLIFPEGTRSRDGRIGRLRSGAAALAIAHGLPIVPVHVTGTRAAMPVGQSWPRRLPGRGPGRRHDVEIRFGAPIRPTAVDDRHAVMERVRQFFASCGAPTTPYEPGGIAVGVAQAHGQGAEVGRFGGGDPERHAGTIQRPRSPG